MSNKEIYMPNQIYYSEIKNLERCIKTAVEQYYTGKTESRVDWEQLSQGATSLDILAKDILMFGMNIWPASVLEAQQAA